MEELKKKRMESTNIKERSWSAYQTNINQLANAITKKPFKNYKFLKKEQVVNAWIEKQNFALAKKRMMYSSILIMISPIKDWDKLIKPTARFKAIKKLYDSYSSILTALSKQWISQQSLQQKSVKQSENWVEWKQLVQLQKQLTPPVKAVIKKYKLNKIGLKYFDPVMQEYTNNATNKQLKMIQEWVIISLYTLIPPRRLDYAGMRVVSKKQYEKLTKAEEKANNYLVTNGRKTWKFSFGLDAQKNKNMDKDGYTKHVYELNIPDDLKAVLQLALNVRLFTMTRDGVRYLLQGKERIKTDDGKPETIIAPMKKDTLSKVIILMMKKYLDKNISASMLRTIYLSSKHKNDISTLEKQKTAEEMGHTTGTAEQSYIKH